MGPTLGAADGGSSRAPAGLPGPRRRRPFEGWGDAAFRHLGVAGGAIARVSVLVFGQVRTRSEAAYADFQKRRKHTRYRAYALGSYSLIAAATLLFQLYDHNSIAAYVRVERVDFPRSASAVFIRNDSQHRWSNVKVTLNGLWLYERPQIEPGDIVLVRVDRFAQVEPRTGKMQFPPPETVARRLRIECDAGRFESTLE